MNKTRKKKYLQLLKDTGQLTKHYKMYKTSKGWAFAAISLLTFGMGITFGQSDAHAAYATTVSSSNTSSVVENDSASLNSSVVKLTSTGTTDTTVTQASSVSSANSSAVASSNVDSSTGTGASSSASTNVTAKVGSNSESSADTISSSSVDKGSSTDVNSDSSATTQATNTSTTADTISSSSATSNSALYESGETLVDPTSNDITSAKAAGSEAYVATGESQSFSAVAATETGDATTSATADATSSVNFWTGSDGTTNNSNTGDYGDSGLTNYVYSDDPFATTVEGTVDTVAKTEVQAKGIYGTVKWYISMDGVLHLGAGQPIKSTGPDSNPVLPLGSTSPWKQYKSLFTTISIDGLVKLVGGSNYLFADLDQITAITGGVNLDFSAATDVTGIFKNTTALGTITGSENWNLSKVGSTSAMFANSGITILDVTNWGLGSDRSSASMFNGASKLTKIVGIGNWSMVSTTNMVYMFIGAVSLQSLDFSNWNTSNVTNMGSMFSGMTALRQITFGAGFVTTKVTGGSVALPNTNGTTKWVNVGTGSVASPEPSVAISTYDGTLVDTYVLKDLSVSGSAIEKDYDGTTVFTETPVITGPAGDYTLKDGDYVFNTTDPVNAGGYTYTLTTQGITNVKNFNSNYDLGDLLDSLQGTATINKAKATITVDDGEFDYDGTSHSIPTGNVTITGAMNGEQLDYSLTNNARTDAGSQTVDIVLTNGSTINANYEITASDTATLTIKPVTTDPTDENTTVKVNNETSSYGESSPVFGINTGSKIKDPGNLTNADFTFIDKVTGQVVDGIPTNVGDYEIHLNTSGQAKVAAANPNYKFSEGSFVSGTYTINDVITHSEITVTRTIHYTGAGSRTPVDVVQTLVYDVATSKATGVSTYTPKGSYSAVKTPEIAGFANSGDVGEVVPETSTTRPTDLTSIVTYSPTNEIEYSEITVTRTIHYVGAGNKTPHDVVETIVYKVATNKTTGKVSYTPQGIYESVTTPDLVGYTHSGDVAKLIPSATMIQPENLVVVVTYQAVSQPGDGGSGNETIPENPEIPGNGGNGNDSSTGENGNGANGITNGSVGNGFSGDNVSGSNNASDTSTHVAVNKSVNVNQTTTNKNNVSQSQLPQTSDDNDQAGAIAGISLLGLLLGWFGFKRRKRDED